MSALGPTANDQDAQHELIPTCAVDVNLATDFDLTTQFACGYARELYVGTGGTVVAQMTGDSGFHTYVNVPSGGFLHGQFITVRSTGNGTTASNIIARR